MDETIRISEFYCIHFNSIQIDYSELSFPQVNDIFELPPCTTRILLSHFNWDKERLLEKFYEDNQDKLFKDAHIVNPFRQARSSIGASSSQTGATALSEDVICDICLLVTPNYQLEGLECQHLYCIDCWRNYLRTRIEDSGNALAIPCPEGKCDILVNEDIVYRVTKPFPNVSTVEHTEPVH